MLTEELGQGVYGNPVVAIYEEIFDTNIGKFQLGFQELEVKLHLDVNFHVCGQRLVLAGEQNMGIIAGFVSQLEIFIVAFQGEQFEGKLFDVFL